MSLRDLLHSGLDRVQDTVEKHGEDWLEKAADRADDAMAEELAPDLAGEGRKLTATVREHSPALAAAGATGVGLIGAYLLGALPKEERAAEARLVYLRTVASAQERSAARLQAGTTMGTVAAERERAWDAFERALKALGEVALRVGWAFLLRSLPA